MVNCEERVASRRLKNSSQTDRPSYVFPGLSLISRKVRVSPGSDVHVTDFKFCIPKDAACPVNIECVSVRNFSQNPFAFMKTRLLCTDKHIV